jgi:Flp pilus assembly secretin CpaC
MLGQVDIWTYETASEIEITSSFGFTTLSVLSSGGTCTIAGNKTANGLASTTITLADGQSVTINSGNNETNIINYLDIIPDGSGTVCLVGR